MFICLSHTALECPRLRYSVSREAPEKGRDLTRCKDDPGNAGPSVRVARSVLGEVVDERTRGVRISNHTISSRSGLAD
jgi:hypothetical protein